MTLSIIVCTKDRPDELRAALRSIVAQSRLPDQIVIVDASGSEDSKRAAEEVLAGSGTELVYEHASPGLTRQRNIGVAKSKGDIVVFLDDDVVLAGDYLEQICLGFASDPEGKIGGVMGFVEEERRVPTGMGKYFRRFFKLSRLEEYGRIETSGLGVLPFLNRKRPLPVEILWGGGMAYRREVFDTFSFDENLTGYALCEDVDFSFRVGRKHRLLYFPAAKLRHRVTPSSRRGPKELEEMRIVHLFYFFRKNYHFGRFRRSSLVLANIGTIFYSLVEALRRRSVAPLAGILRGYIKVLKGDMPGRRS